MYMVLKSDGTSMSVLGKQAMYAMKKNAEEHWGFAWCERTSYNIVSLLIYAWAWALNSNPPCIWLYQLGNCKYWWLASYQKLILYIAKGIWMGKAFSKNIKRSCVITTRSANHFFWKFAQKQNDSLLYGTCYKNICCTDFYNIYLMLSKICLIWLQLLHKVLWAQHMTQLLHVCSLSFLLDLNGCCNNMLVFCNGGFRWVHWQLYAK